jgi:hypothetical protein
MSLGERRLAGAVAGVAPVSPVRVQSAAVEHRRGWLVRRMLLLADVVGLAAAFVLAHVLLGSLVRRHSVERVIFAFSRQPSERIVDAIRSLQEENVQIDVVPRLYELLSPNVSVHTVEGLPVIGRPPSRLPRSSRLLKRATDIVLAAVGLVIVAPLFIVIAAAIKFESRGPVFFCQTRMGSRRSFGLYKVRTMAPHADKRKHEFAHLNEHARVGGDPRMLKIRDDPRVTRVGRVLRRYSLDELPQPRECAERRNEPESADAARRGGGFARRELGAAPTRSEAGNHRAMAGARA